MMKIIFITILIQSCLFANAQYPVNTTAKGDGYYVNPIFAGDYPDPSILRDGNDYYIVHSSFEYYPGLLIWHSKDLIDWTPVTHALHKYVGSVWAPDLVKYKNKYYIYFPANNTNYVVTADAIGGPWSDPIDLKVGNIDPGHVVDADGKRYLYFSGGGYAPLADDGLSITGEVKYTYAGWPIPRQWSIECFCMEGPKLVKRGDYYYLNVAEGGTAGPATSHMVVSARSKSPFGPWENSPFNPIIRTKEPSEKWWSKGHGTLFEDAKGKWWMVFHGYENGYYNMGRQTLLQPVEWTKDGWFKTPDDIKTDQPIKRPADIASPSRFTLNDDFSGTELGAQWKFYQEYDTSRFHLMDSSLVINAKGHAVSDCSPLLCVPPDHSYRAQVELFVEGNATGGLVLFYNSTAYSGIVADKENILAILRSWQFPTEKGIIKNHVYLRLENRDNTVNMYYSTDGIKWNKIENSVEVSSYNHNVLGGFVSLRLGLCSVGEGKIRFRNFKYTPIDTDAGVQERVIKADFRQEKGKLNTSFKECVGAGRANEGLRADWQQQLAIAKKECGFTYIRMHGLLTDDMGVYKEDGKGNPSYNYQYIDVLYDYILSIGMKPFVELGFMPNALASGSQAIFWWRGNTTPPKDYAKWEALIRNLTLHFTERYGPEEVKTWYFEVWNEPNLSGFWAGTQQDYFKLYASSVKAIKSVNTAYRVGGPATAGAAWVPEMIDFCSTNALPLDFISTHAYGVNQGFLDEFGTSGTVLSKNAWSVSGDMLNSRKQILNSSMPGLELHYTEWSSSYTPTDPIHDSYHEAAYILEKIKQAGNAVNSMSYWTFTDIFEEAGPRFTPFHGGFGLLNYQGIKKPAFYSFSLLNKLGNTELANADSSSWVCKNAQGDIQVLYWDFTNTLPDSTNDQQYYIRDLPSKPKGKVKVEIAGIPEGTYRLEIYKVGYKANDPYTSYFTLNRPNQLTGQQVDHIKQENNGSPVSTENITVKAEGTFSKELSIRENDVFLLNLIKTPPVSITVNLLQDQGNLPPIWEFFGYDEANYTYMKDGRKLLTELSALSPVRVNVRTHNLLTSGNGTPGLKWSSTNAYTEDATGKPVYDWKITDSIFDIYIQRGMKPLVEIGFMPEAMSINPGSEPKHYSGWAYPPKSYEKWAELVFQWVKHSVQRYGKAEVEGWYWEVWNEPDLTFYWKGSVDDYIKLYDYTADAVKRALPAAKIGGPETTSPDGRSGGEYIRQFLTHIVSGTNYVTGKKGAPIDFISFHAKGSPKLIDNVVWMNMGNQLRSIDKGFEIVSSIPSLKNLPIIIGESDPEGCAACSEDLHPENAYRNNTMYACYTAAAVARTYDLAKKWSVNLAGAVTWGFEFEDQPYFRGFRDLATNGIDKPVLNVFRMLGMMQGNRVATESTSKQNYITVRDSSVRGPEPDVNALATKSTNDAAVLVWNYHDKNDLHVAPTDVSLMIKGLPQHRVLLTQYIIDQEHSNSFTVWKKMGSPKQLTTEEYKTLEAAGQLEEISSPKYITPVNGEAKINFDLQRQAITLLKVSW